MQMEKSTFKSSKLSLTNTEIDDLINTTVAAEATEEYIPTYTKPPTCPAEFFYENELVRKKMSK